jgi:hypothetical protein
MCDPTPHVAVGLAAGIGYMSAARLVWWSVMER